MKRILFVNIFLLSFVAIFSQQMQLNWLPMVDFAIDSVACKALSVERGVYDRSQFLPSISVDLANGSPIEVTNVSLVPLSAEEQNVAESDLNAIPEQLEWQQFSATERKKTHYRASIFPFVKQNNQIFKAVSFDLEQNSAPQLASEVPQKAMSYAANSVLRSGKFVKIAVGETGIYKLTYEQLKQMGIDPKNVRIFGYGGLMLEEYFKEPYIDDLPEVALYQHVGSDGVFGEGDFVLFYAQGPEVWRWHSSGTFRVYKNVYSTRGYYFVTSDAGVGKRISPVSALPINPALDTITTYTDFWSHDIDEVSLINSGRTFYGEKFSGSKMSHTFNNSVSDVVADEATFRMSAASKSQPKTYFTIDVNGVTLKDKLQIDGLEGQRTYVYAMASKQSNPFRFNIPAGNRLNVKLTFSHETGTAWLDFFELNFRRKLKLQASKPTFFQNVDYLDLNQSPCFAVEGASLATQIWRLTDPQNVVSIPTSLKNGKALFADNINKVERYVALNPETDTFFEPEIIGTIPNQNIHGKVFPEMVILAPKEFLSEAERLADAHRDVQNMVVHVLDVEQVYNEFSSGTPDATAYRRLMKYFYDRAATDDEMPRYLLLFGDGNFDNRKILGENDGKLLTFQSYNSVHGTDSYVCDDYFALLDDNEGANGSLHQNSMDIGVGRFTVSNLNQAKILVDKSIAYLENRNLGSWKNQVIFLADDGDGNLHTNSADKVARSTAELYPDLLLRKLYLDSYQQEVSASGESYPLALDLFDHYIKDGSLLINYMGHGGHTDWTNEGLINRDRLLAMYNEYLPVYVTATCDFTRFDSGDYSGGELLILNENGGAIALFTTTRTVYAEPNLGLNMNITNAIFSRDGNNKRLRFGDVMRVAKNTLSSDSNKMNFTLLGDPALELAYASTHDVFTDSIAIDVPNGSILTDTIRALSNVTLYGHVSHEKSSEIDESFNGTVSVNVFDKEEQIFTLCNDNPTNCSPMSYFDRTNALFVGQAEVVDGRFEVKFVVPKDIRYNYGEGRIVYYAADPDSQKEGNGFDQAFVVGGEDANAKPDSDAPRVQIYLNTPQFRSGDKTNESPLFVAQIEDDCGINAIGSGIGHDIVLKLDNDPKQTLILNNYFATEMGDYKRGTVKYQLIDLPEGKHHLTFRVWDLQNNSATETLQFEVVKGLQPTLYDMFAYPNPATTNAKFIYRHDRPAHPMTVSVVVADVAGSVVHREQRNVLTNSNLTEIDWDFAGKMMPGVYLVRMSIGVADGEIINKTTKLIIR